MSNECELNMNYYYTIDTVNLAKISATRRQAMVTRKTNTTSSFAPLGPPYFQKKRKKKGTGLQDGAAHDLCCCLAKWDRIRGQ